VLELSSLAAAPVIAELAFEMFHRFAHRETLRQLGRVAQTLPTLGKWAWLRHPVRSHRTLDAHIKAALTEHEAVAERREEVATVRARAIVSVPVPAITLERIESAAPLSTDTGALPGNAHGAPLTTPAERPALNPQAALTEPAQTLAERPAHRPTLNTTERAHKAATSTERARPAAQGASSLDERKALHERQDTLTLTLWKTLNARPEWTEIRDALTAGGLESVSRPTAQRIRERVQKANPDLPTERPKTLTVSQ
jgi:hypothetical protein